MADELSNQALKKVLDQTVREIGLGTASRSFQDLLYGIDILPGQGQPVPKNKDSQGLVLFTRPLFNLSYDNLTLDRRLEPLKTSDPRSYQWMVRALLDPWRAKVNPDSPLVDNENAFMPVLSNTLLSMSGWPDIVGDTYTATLGAQKETWAMFDGTSKIRNDWDAQLTFKNIQGDPVTLLLLTWIIYGTGVYEDNLTPYTRLLFENRIDYQTAIYRLTLSADGRYVTNIAKTIAFPYAITMGAKFNYQADSFLNNDTDTISVPFKCIGAEYNDPILVREFNQTVGSFNRGMRTGSLKKLRQDELFLFNRLAYPKIDEESQSMKLNWYVHPDVYSAVVDEYLEGKGRLKTASA